MSYYGLKGNNRLCLPEETSRSYVVIYKNHIIEAPKSEQLRLEAFVWQEDDLTVLVYMLLQTFSVNNGYLNRKYLLKSLQQKHCLLID
jgi:hypothetical protein